MNIKLSKIGKHYGNLVLFKDLDMEFKEGRISVLTGPSGCGKTTLLNIIAGLDREYNGEITGTDPERISYVFQEPRLIESMTAAGNIRFVLDGKKLDEIPEDIVKENLRLVKMNSFKDYYPNELSGGMKQRVSLARAFAYPSDLVLMDEPFSGIDMKLKDEMVQDFLSLHSRKKRSIIFVTHNIDEIVGVADEVFVFGGQPAHVKETITIERDKIPQGLRHIDGGNVVDNAYLDKIRSRIIESLQGVERKR